MSRLGKILENLEQRDVGVYGILAFHKEHGLQLICYDDEGLVSFISEKVNNLRIYTALNRGGMHEVAVISRTDS